MRTVLVIDDNPAVCEALSLLLSLRDIRPLTAASPDEGLALLAREQIGLVIQDMNFTADTTSGEEREESFVSFADWQPRFAKALQSQT